MNTDINGTGEFGTVWVTCKTVNATAGSRTAIEVDIAPGMVLSQDTYNHDGDGTPNFTRTTSTTRSNRKCVILPGGVPESVNEFVTGSTTQRKGGKVKVAFQWDKCTRLYVEGTTDIAVGDSLSPTDDQYYLVKDTTAGLDLCAIAGAAYTTNSAGYITSATFRSQM
jgi:hypothetical protein